MGKIGYAPKWGLTHTKAYEEFQQKKNEPGFVSPKFKDVDKAMNWLNEQT